ncbi:MAG: hypothetical protein APF77_07470 [Clostridia bacterium BRH_c25]|nr:MAG: hypothetical protein APF77_07470 [Clostridia bacterium BRH_c25]
MKRIISIFITLTVMCSLLLGTVYAEPNLAAKFKDVKETDWFAEAVGKMNILNIIDGLPDGSFNPQGQVTRAQFVKMLVQAMEYKKIDSISFEDLKPFKSSKPHWACVYIETALRNGVIVKAELGDSFFPDVPLTRKDMGMMMFRALELTASVGENPFADLMEANGYLTRLYEEYLIRGTAEGGKVLYKPEGLTTRAEAAVIINRMVEYKADPAEYVKTAGFETRIKEGTATEEDMKLKRDMELKKQAEDENYIVEPVLSVVKSPEIMYFEKFIYSYICLDNYAEYVDDVEVRAVCITDDTQNYGYSQNISTRKYHETRSDEWYTIAQYKSVNRSIISMVNKRDGVLVNGVSNSYDYNYKSGTVLVYEIQIKRGNSLKKYIVDVVIP